MDLENIEIEIGWSASKHFIMQRTTRDDILWAFENHQTVDKISEDPEKFMTVGYDTKGRPLELGFVIKKKGVRIIHCMKCRKQYEYLLR